MGVEINWKLIGDAVEFYKDHGFEYVEVPWIVARDIAEITIPEGLNYDCVMVAKDHGVLVGSAEQSFLQLQFMDSHLSLNKPGRFVSCSPCFRNEPVIDKWHRQTFMKVELYVTLPDHHEACEEIIGLAMKFFDGHIADDVADLRRIMTPLGYDIELNGIEIGSYGMRKFGNHAWVYGTGLAEPRFSSVLNGSCSQRNV